MKKVVLVLVLLFSSSCVHVPFSLYPFGLFDSESTREKVTERAGKALEAIKARDMEALSQLVHPEQGVRFSPYGNVDPENDVRMTADQVRGLMENDKVRVWGRFDGSGKPIKMTAGEYFDRFVFDRDYTQAPETAYNGLVQTGNTIVTIEEMYPEASYVSYHYPGQNPDYGGLDWSSLRLVFEKHRGTWYLTGVVHGQWTI
jgi:hypothetical protein